MYFRNPVFEMMILFDEHTRYYIYQEGDAGYFIYRKREEYADYEDDDDEIDYGEDDEEAEKSENRTN